MQYLDQAKILLSLQKTLSIRQEHACCVGLNTCVVLPQLLLGSKGGAQIIVISAKVEAACSGRPLTYGVCYEHMQHMYVCVYVCVYIYI